ncbi:hypothetical protein BN59_00338 [Legionella massiliensis]|uniref:Outer membrane protein beta-barrel domain-containing protein n=1 Tax=Legionella massiliensis TaxID=1034943 RepID=A0A078KWE5_9GAMM|nr:outer membrane beta-barrel protein [Legionella massiliensis]CDZ76074.1 hypothetical protein BN59_00338 [Legionella massiliensis]CEE11812.1 hypothetical protein BN1094_00338 [Legionella massiliensis]
MKLNKKGKSLNYSRSMMGILFALASINGNAGTMGPTVINVPGKIYFGVFGGGGSSEKVDIRQYGTAFFTEANGGPLAVDAFGRAHTSSVGMVGGHVGFQWLDMSSNLFNSQWNLAPAFELEGYYLGKDSLTGHDINNDTARLPEHDFLVKYPTTTGVFLVNAVLNLNSADSRFHPYIGGGIGGAVQSVSRAKAIQVSPPEIGVNHYNSRTSSTDSAFAAQGKVGLGFDLNKNFSVFAEYRGLYIADTSYVFGSTVYPGHAPTSSWQVEMDSKYYNLGAVGIHYTV